VSPEIFQKLAEYGIIATILALFIFATYRKVWVPGRDLKESEERRVKDIANLDLHYEHQIARLASDRDAELSRRQSEIEMWRQMALREIDHGRKTDNDGSGGSQK
jgi:hypothetical protein